MNGSSWNATPEPGHATRLLHDDGTEALPLGLRVADKPNVVAYVAQSRYGPRLRVHTIDRPTWHLSLPWDDGCDLWNALAFAPGDRDWARAGQPTPAYLPMTGWFDLLRPPLVPAAALHAA